ALKISALGKEKVKALVAAANVSAKMKALLEARFDAAHSETTARWNELIVGRSSSVDSFVGASLRLLEAERELSTGKGDQVAALENQRQRMAELEKIWQAKFDAGVAPTSELSGARFARLQAEILLERAKAP